MAWFFLGRTQAVAGSWTLDTSCSKSRPVLEKKRQLWILVQGWFQKLPWSSELSPQVSWRWDGGEWTLSSSCLSHHRGWPLLPRVTTAQLALTGPGLQKLPARFRCPLRLVAPLPPCPQGSGPAEKLCLLPTEQLHAFLGLFLSSWEPPASNSACETSGHRSYWALAVAFPRHGPQPVQEGRCMDARAQRMAPLPPAARGKHRCPSRLSHHRPSPAPPLSPACSGAPGSAHVHFLDVLTVMWLKHRSSGQTARWD